MDLGLWIVDRGSWIVDVMRRECRERVRDWGLGIRDWGFGFEVSSWLPGCSFIINGYVADSIHRKQWDD